MFTRDFREETIYFVFIDRFHNADPENDLGVNPELSDPTRQNWERYWGGDLQGVIDKLDYLAALGVSSIWITPVFDQVDDLCTPLGSAPYHGYWTKDFKRLDEHLVPVEERGRPFASWDTVFDRLLAEAHRRDMRVFLDVSINHTHAGGANTPKGDLYDDGVWLTSHEDDRLGWYNRHGPIRDWQSAHELRKGELKGGLADLNEDVWECRHYLIETMAAWLDRGVDGFRLDAVKHMSLSFWQEFVATMRKHKPDVVLFGEWAGIGHWDTMGVHFANRSGMSVLDFSFQYAVEDVLCRKRTWRRIAEVFHHDHVYADATELVTFLDNHDMPRLLSSGMPEEHLPLAVTLLMTARGVPCLFYGTEQALHCDTDDGIDPYNRPMMEKWDLDSEVASLLPRLAGLRRRSLAIQRGFTRDVVITEDVYAFARQHGESAVLVVLNRGAATSLDLLDLPLPDGSYRDQTDPHGPAIVVRERAILGLEVEAGGFVVLDHDVPPPRSRTRVVIRLNGYAARIGETVVVLGDCPELGRWNPADAVALHYVNGNLWTGDLCFDESAGESVLYRFAILESDGTIRYEDTVPRTLDVPVEGVWPAQARWRGNSR